MQQGSLVVVKHLPFKAAACLMYNIDWLPNDNERDIYTLREVTNASNTGLECVCFEEGVIGYYNGEELVIQIEFVREVQPPMDVSIEALLEQEELV